jgi:cystathionine gamma-synthase
MTDVVAVSRALRRETRLVWVETPSNPRLRISDIQKLSELAHENDALLAADGTWTTPILQRPLALGADLVVHSLTKYMSGHSDLLAGAAVARKDSAFFARLMTLQKVGGAVASPFDCWLTLRGLRSLHARMRIHCENARRVADFLDGHPKVRAVHYPGLKNHPGHRTARDQMDDFGGMLAFEVEGGRAHALAVAAKCRVFTRATSLGGTESLIEHRESIESKPTPTPPGLLRLSVGLEHVNDLLEDLDHALAG